MKAKGSFSGWNTRNGVSFKVIDRKPQGVIKVIIGFLAFASNHAKWRGDT